MKGTNLDIIINNLIDQTDEFDYFNEERQDIKRVMFCGVPCGLNIHSSSQDDSIFISHITLFTSHEDKTTFEKFKNGIVRRYGSPNIDEDQDVIEGVYYGRCKWTKGGVLLRHVNSEEGGLLCILESHIGISSKQTNKCDIPFVTAGDSFVVAYRHPINGYKVRAVVKQDNYSFNSADISFTKEGKTFTLHTISFGDTLYSKLYPVSIGDNDEIMLKYRYKIIDSNYRENREGNETMPGKTPFFFRDLDFDGKKELVIVNFAMGVRQHSEFDVYRIVEGKPILIDYPPYRENAITQSGMTDYPEFDFKKKTISCPYPEGELHSTGCKIYGVSKKQKDTIVVNQ